jgi:hypothetical protein
VLFEQSKDTTAHTMAFALIELTKPENKRVFDKLMQEIDSVIPSANNNARFIPASPPLSIIFLYFGQNSNTYMTKKDIKSDNICSRLTAK